MMVDGTRGTRTRSRTSRRRSEPWVGLRIGLIGMCLLGLTGAAAAQPAGDYALGPGDVLAITVWDQLLSVASRP